MAKQRPNQSPAEFLRAQGWNAPGTILSGDPILSDFGKVLERAIQFKVTAVGERGVLVRSRHLVDLQRDGTAVAAVPFQEDEHMATFDAREWKGEEQ